MFGYVVLGVTALVGGFIAITESMKSTGEKVRDGDTVSVPGSALIPNNPADTQALSVFVQSFVSINVNVSGVVRDPSNPKLAHGTIIGLTPGVAFPLAAVTSITRGGKRIV